MKRKKLTILENLIEKKFGSDPLIDEPVQMETGPIKKVEPEKPITKKNPPAIMPVVKPKKK